MMIKENESAIVYQMASISILNAYDNDLETAISRIVAGRCLGLELSTNIEDAIKDHLVFFEEQVKKPAKYYKHNYYSYRSERYSSYYAVRLARANIILAGYDLF